MPLSAAERAEALSMEVAELRIANRDLRRDLVLAREQRAASIAREMGLHVRLAAAQAGRLAPPRTDLPEDAHTNFQHGD
jgi:hypothetical protein